MQPKNPATRSAFHLCSNVVTPVCLFLSLLACDQDGPQRANKHSLCRSSDDCGPAQTCERGACIALQGCQAGSCGANEYCADDGTCKKIDEVCNGGLCACHFINLAGAVADREDALLHSVPANFEFTPQIIFTDQSGVLLPLQAESFQVNSAAFSVDKLRVKATDAPGTATLTAVSGSIRCSGRITNLGSPPKNGRLRVLVVHQNSGQPIAGARVIVSNMSGGQDVGMAPITDDLGTTSTGAAVPSEYTITALAPGFHYLSVAGLTAAAGADIVLPLQPARRDLGGFSGLVNFQEYEHLQLDDRARPIRFAIANATGPLTNLLTTQFDLAGLQDGADGEGCPGVPGCISAKLGDADFFFRLPANILLETPAIATQVTSKSYYDARVDAGMRLPFVVGGEMDLLAASALEQLPTGLLAAYASDDDVGDSLQTLVETMVHVIPELALGVHSETLLARVSDESWARHIDPANLVHRSETPVVDIVQLDGQQHRPSPMSLKHRVNHFSDVRLPDYPKNSELDTTVVLTGSVIPGLGFMPLGLGFGMDCMRGSCFGSDGPYDGKVAGVALCAGGGACAGRPQFTADGHLALYQALPFAGLESQQLVTVALSMSVHSLRQHLIASGVFAPGLVQGATSDLIFNHPRPYPEIPVMPSGLQGRRYKVAALSDSPSAHWLRLSNMGAGGEPGLEWNVFVQNGADFVAPILPSRWNDFSTKLGVPVSDMALHFRPGVSISSLVARHDDGLANFAKNIEGFAVRSEADFSVKQQ